MDDTYDIKLVKDIINKKIDISKPILKWVINCYFIFLYLFINIYKVLFNIYKTFNYNIYNG